MQTRYSKHFYEFVAAAIHYEREQTYTVDGRVALDNLAEEFAVRFGADNPRFDREKFLEVVHKDEG